QLGCPVACPTVLLGNGEPHPAELGHLLPDGPVEAGGGHHHLPDGRDRQTVGEELTCRVPEESRLLRRRVGHADLSHAAPPSMEDPCRPAYRPASRAPARLAC